MLCDFNLIRAFVQHYATVLETTVLMTAKNKTLIQQLTLSCLPWNSVKMEQDSCLGSEKSCGSGQIFHVCPLPVSCPPSLFSGEVQSGEKEKAWVTCKHWWWHLWNMHWDFGSLTQEGFWDMKGIHHKATQIIHCLDCMFCMRQGERAGGA